MELSSLHKRLFAAPVFLEGFAEDDLLVKEVVLAADVEFVEDV